MSRIEFVAIPTAQRPSELRRAVQSFSAHLSRHGQSLPVIVFHTPRSESDQRQVKDALLDAGAGGIDVRYVGLSEKVAMAKELKRLSGVSPVLLEHALFHRDERPPPVGANRNAMLLWGAGGGFLSADDDTLADIYSHPDLDPTAPLSKEMVEGDPSDYFVADDLTPWRLAPGDPREPPGGIVGCVESAWDQSARRGFPSPLAYLGLAGDCGWGAPFGFWGRPLGYLLVRTPTLRRLAASQDQWARVLRSRRLLRATDRPQLARDAPGMSTCMGVDARGELPPFVPVGRGQDLLFCAMVERLYGAPSVWLPIAVAHEPASVRRFHDGQLLSTAGSLDLCGVFFALLETIPENANLVEIGRHLQKSAAQDSDSFVEELHAARRRLQGRLIEASLARAAGLDLPSYWREDLERYCQRAAEALESTEPPWVLDAGAEDALTSLRTAQGLVSRYGELCEAWPSLWAAAGTQKARRDDGTGASPLRPTLRAEGAKKDRAPRRCSPYQTWLWHSYLIDPTDTAHLTFRAFLGTGPLDPSLFEQALRALAERHEALRCKFRGTEDGEAILLVRPSTELVVNKSGALGPSERAAAREKERTSPINIVEGLPLRVTLVPAEEAEGAWELWLAFHHIALDGASEEIFWRELEVIERNLGAGRPAHDGLPPLRATYCEIAERQREALSTSDTAPIERHWQDVLDGAPSELSVSYRTQSVARDRTCNRVQHAVPPALCVELKKLARTQESSVAAIVLTAWQAVLARWSGEPDVVIALAQTNRWDESEEKVIGLFMTTLPLRAKLLGERRLDAVLHENRVRIAETFAWGRIPFERLAKPLYQKLRRFDIFGVLFTHLVRAEPPRLQGVPLQPLELEYGQAGYELGLTVEESPQGASLILLGNRALFDAGDLERLADGIVTALRALCLDATAPISTINWLSEADRGLLERWNSTTAVFPDDKPLVALLRQTALAQPDAVALETTSDERISYRELWLRAESIALRLRADGVDCDERVGIYLDRTPAMLVAMLAVLIAGGGYVPLDPALPRDRIKFMIEDCDPRVLLTSTSRALSLPQSMRARIVCIDAPADERQEPQPGWRGPAPDSLAYVIYTSGSTGRPKGVEVTNRSLVNFLTSMAREPGLNSSDVLLALTTLSFDIAALELWLPLLVGARIVLAGREEAGDGSQLAAALERSGATVLQATPTTWRALFAAGWRGDSGLKALVGGEALALDLAQRLAESCGEAWNLYGPTETTIWSSVWRIPRDAQAVRIGKPIANTQLRVLDDLQRQAPLGVRGQLYIGGAGVARGYLHQPELTAERFVKDPRHGLGRFYATGDVARWLPEGALEFLGRDDDQIKLRGHRIELGEIEAALLRLPNVTQAAVAVRRSGQDEPRLVAYLALPSGTALPASADLRARLREWLPDQMLPYGFVQVQQLPLTPSGKVDRGLLSSSSAFESAGSSHSESEAPASALEFSLIEHFRSLLDGSVGPNTDFFEAGGDSLKAMQLMSRIAKGHDHELTTGELFLSATPRLMAARLGQLKQGAFRPRHLVLMRPGSGSAAAFLVHAMGGHLLPYGRLAHHLETTMSVYGLQGLLSSSEHSYATIEERCAAYVREVLEEWSGPVVLAGYSLGGPLAMEMACQLRRAGREVSLVILLDSPAPRPQLRGWAKVRFRASEMSKFSWSDWRIWAGNQISRRFFGEQFVGEAHDQGDRRSAAEEAEIQLMAEQMRHWRPFYYDGRVQYFQAESHPLGYSLLTRPHRWDRFTSNLKVVLVPGDHLQMMREPLVRHVAAEIGAALASTSDAEMQDQEGSHSCDAGTTGPPPVMNIPNSA